MATKPKTSDAVGKVKFRVIEFELEGTDAAMQETIRGFTAALNRNPSAPVSRQLRGPAKHIESNGETGPAAEEEEVLDAEEVEEAEEVTHAARSRPAAPRKVKTYEVMENLVFDDVSPTLKEFAKSKAPTKDLPRYLVIAYWYKHHKKQPPVTAGHFYTAYRLLGWKVPADPAAPMRELRATRDGRLSKGSETGTFVINQVGENHVDELGTT